MRKNLIQLLCCTSLLVSCWDFGPRFTETPEKNVWGYKPVYSTDSTLLAISVDSAKPIKNAGKIYAINELVLQNELGRGLHVIDRSNPQQPKNIGFINIRGNSEVSIKGNLLYANSFSDLVVINFSHWSQASEVKRIKNAFQKGNQTYNIDFLPPPQPNVYFECVNMSKGIHIGWVQDSVSNRSCFY